VIFQLYDSQNPLHAKFLAEMEARNVFSRIQHRYGANRVTIVQVDVSKQNTPLVGKLLKLANID